MARGSSRRGPTNRQAALFVPQCFHGIEARGLPRGIHPKSDSDHCAKDQREQHPENRNRRREREETHGHPQARSERSEEHTSELQSRLHLVCRLLLEKKKKNK